MSMHSPYTGGADGRYWEALEEGHLELPRCVACGRWHWPAVWRCGDCGSWEQAWHAVPLKGRVYTHSRNHHAFAGLEGIAIPFVTLVVELPEAGGVRLMGLLEGDADGLAIGSAVEGFTARTPYGDRSVPAVRWRLTGGGA